MNNVPFAMKKIAKPLLPGWIFRVRARHHLSSIAKKYGMTLSFHQDFSELTRGPKVLRIAANQTIYIPGMIESFDLYFDSVVPIQVGNRFIVDLSGPRYHRLIGFDELPLMFPSQSEPFVTTTQYLEFANLTEGQVAFDLGAYAGVASIVFAQRVGKSGAVFAFEADPNNFLCAAENIRLARQWLDVHNITLVESAVWSHREGLEFSTEGTMASSAASIIGRGRGSVIRVASTTIADFCASRGIDKVDFIKMDIEGAEIEVLKASQQILTRLKPRLIVEPHLVESRMSTDPCCEILANCGYKIRLIQQIGFSVPLIEATPIRERKS